VPRQSPRLRPRKLLRRRRCRRRHLLGRRRRRASEGGIPICHLQRHFRVAERTPLQRILH
jgi:hypothetical protein